ncbi:hypothetical protein JTE90_010317 [Oedothorax gibbosus]|uniref:Uncharacterized protein n=1 Tax=Oedothorax gibbosus TaxID=931172 RepID=A0AAV6V4B5_9ARAC|nr:hypothetical protein JTE90_010317 [Oedothorax gibbosus]
MGPEFMLLLFVVHPSLISRQHSNFLRLKVILNNIRHLIFEANFFSPESTLEYKVSLMVKIQVTTGKDLMTDCFTLRGASQFQLVSYGYSRICGCKSLL